MAQPYPPYQGMTPQDVASARQYGQGLMQQGTDASPVGHWTQALARVLQGGVGGYEVGSANRGEAEGRASANKLLAQALQGGDLKSSVGSMLAHPWAADTGKDLGVALIKHGIGHSPEEQKAKIAQMLASAESSRAHARYYDAAGKKLTQREPAATPPQAAPSPEPSYGMTEDGQIIPPSHQTQHPAFSLPQNGNVPRLPPPASADGVVIQGQPQRPPGMMRLGGPTDDIDASMRLDEGRRSFGPPQGVQLAQAGAPVTSDGMPTLMERYRGQMFGQAGGLAESVPGIVRKTPSGGTDVPATREAAGQRAYEGATPEQQERYRKFRQEQQLWTSAYGKPARAGYYYGPRGEELAMSEKTYKGDKDNNALMDMNLKIIAEAQKKLTDTSWPVQAVAGYLPNTDTKLAISDLKGAATQIAFILSGKSVSNAERAEFMERYAPTPTDSNYAINHKVGRMKMFYQTLIEAKRAGMDEQKAWNFATAKTLSTPLPDNPARGLSDDELLKELNK